MRDSDREREMEREQRLRDRKKKQVLEMRGGRPKGVSPSDWLPAWPEVELGAGGRAAVSNVCYYLH